MRAALKIWLVVLALALSACGGSNDPSSSDWKDQPYDVPAGKNLNSVLQDISTLSGISFSVDPVLQASLDAAPPTLPILLGLNAAQVLVLLQDTMPAEQAFFYQELSAQSIVLIPRFQQAEDLTGADPITIIDFDTFTQLGFKALFSDPQVEEAECGGPAELGDGGIFEFVTEVESDPDGHSEFIGEFPPLVEYIVEGNQISFFGDPPWVTVGGTILVDGSFIATGSGTVAGFPDVSVEFLGQAQPGLLTGSLTMGAGGELPGGNPAVYNVHP